jgi:RNA polymerase sigma factor (sigma-70 family)
MTASKREPETPGRPSSGPSAPPGLADLTRIRAAWIDFYDTHYHRMVRFVMHVGACRQDAQDAVHEAFTESWNLMYMHPDQWQAVTNKEGWIRKVALLRYHRPPGRRIRPQLAETPVRPDLPHSGLEPGELTAQTQLVLQALRALDEESRAVMAFHLDDFTTKDIAAALELTEQRVRDVRKKARVSLRAALINHTHGQVRPGRRPL